MFSIQISRIAAELARLRQSITEEQRRPLPDSLRLTSFKRRKLALKDELSGADVSAYAARFGLIPIRVTKGRDR